MAATTANAPAQQDLQSLIEQEIAQFESFEAYMNHWYVTKRFEIQNIEELTERQAYLQARQRQDQLEALTHDTNVHHAMVEALTTYENALKTLSEEDVKVLAQLMPEVDVWCPIAIRHALEKLLQEEEQGG